MAGVRVRDVGDADRAWIDALVASLWGSEIIVVHEEVYRPASLPGLVAEELGRPVGLLTYHVDDRGSEIVTIDAFDRGRGIGTALVEALEAKRPGRLWLVTTNDNVAAQRFYEKLGFALVAVRVGAVDRSRARKPEIPRFAKDGTPITHELVYERLA